MAERRNLKRNRNLISGSMALNVNSSAVPKEDIYLMKNGK